MSYKLRILSLGAGIQSTTLYLMAQDGLIEPFDVAVFADTGWERQATYDVINTLKSKYKTPIITVKTSNIKEDMLEAKKSQRRFASMPLHCVNGDKCGMLQRQCTREYKIIPINKELRKLLGLQPKQRYTGEAIELCLGISKDESIRTKSHTDNKYKTNAYPLLDLNLNRWDCEQYLRENHPDIEVVKSSCIGCPFHHNNEWRSLNESELKDAINFDEQVRDGFAYKNIKSQRLYLHQSKQPLAEVDLRTQEQKGQLRLFDYDKQESFKSITGG